MSQQQTTDREPEIAAHKNIELTRLRGENIALRAALVEHNDLLRSAFQAAQRDATHDVAGTTNFRLLANRLAEALEKHHAITNAARGADNNTSEAIAPTEVYETALREIVRLGALVAHDLQGRVEAGKVMAVQRLADMASEALTHGR